MSDTPTPLTDALLAEYPATDLSPDGNVVYVVAGLIGHARALERRITELERAQRDAPHERHCPVTSMTDKRPCNCWKSRVRGLEVK